MLLKILNLFSAFSRHEKIIVCKLMYGSAVVKLLMDAQRSYIRIRYWSKRTGAIGKGDRWILQTLSVWLCIFLKTHRKILHFPLWIMLVPTDSVTRVVELVISYSCRKTNSVDVLMANVSIGFCRWQTTLLNSKSIRHWLIVPMSGPAISALL